MVWSWQALPSLVKLQVVRFLGRVPLNAFGCVETTALLELMGPDAAAEALLDLKAPQSAVVASRMFPPAAATTLRSMSPRRAARIVEHMSNILVQEALIESGLFVDMVRQDVALVLTRFHCRVAARYVEGSDVEDSSEWLAMMDVSSAARILEVVDGGAVADILKSIPNDRTIAAIVNELPSSQSRQIMARFEEEQKTAVMWEAMHLELGDAAENSNATYNFAWADVAPWDTSPRSCRLLAEGSSPLTPCSEGSRASSEVEESSCDSCDGVGAETLGFTRRRRDDTRDLMPIGDRALWRGIRWAYWTS